MTDVSSPSEDLDIEPEQGDERQARIGFALITPRGFDFGAEVLLDSLTPGTQVTRYRRVWRLARISQQGGFVRSRIGFEREGATAELWDERAQDFYPAKLLEGATSPFVASLQTGVVAFQIRPGVIRRQTFAGALQALLNESSESVEWRVEDLVREIDWDTWLTQVDRVVEVRVTVERPNPTWGKRRQLRRLVEDTGSRIVTLAAQADPASATGLDVEKDLLGEAIEHVQAGYGRRSAVGEITDGQTRRRVEWREAVRGVPVEAEATTQVSTSEADPDELQRIVESPLSEIPYLADEVQRRQLPARAHDPGRELSS